MDGRTYGNSPLCPTGHWPFGAAAQKVERIFVWRKQWGRRFENVEGVEEECKEKAEQRGDSRNKGKRMVI